MMTLSLGRTWAISVALFLACSISSSAINVAVSNVPGSTISFNGTSDTFQFPDATSGAFVGRDIRVTGSDGAGDSVGLVGNLSGVFTIGPITVLGPLQAAAVSGTGSLSISDGSTSLTATVQWGDIFTNGATGGLNTAGTANLSNISYSGSNLDLQALAASPNGTMTLTFQFAAATSLTQLTTNGTTHNTSYSANIVVVPCSGQIGDFVWEDLNANGCQDANEPGIQGVTVNLYQGCGQTGTPIATTTTNGQGKYLFTGLCAGNYTVSFVTPSGYTRTVANATCDTDPNISDTLDSDCDCTDPNAECGICVTLTTDSSVDLTIDCGYVMIPGSIGDTVFCDKNGNGIPDAGEGIPGVDVILNCVGQPPVTATTDANGKYLFTGIAPGVQCTVTVDTSTVPMDCDFPSPNCADEYIKTLAPGESFLDADFCYVPPGQIGDTVFCDKNGNGIADAGEGIPGVDVILNCVGQPPVTKTTDANGMYLFTGIAPGVMCTVSVVAGTVPTDCDIPSPDCKTLYEVTLAPGQSFLDADFCYKPECALEVEAFCAIPAPPSSGSDCDGSKIKRILMEYTADDCSVITNPQSGKATCAGVTGPLPNNVFVRASDKSSPTDSKAKVWFEGPVSKGGTYQILASNAGASQFASNTYVHIFQSQGGALLQTVTIHTSCSQPIAAGDQFAANRILELSFTSGKTTTVPNPQPNIDCQITLGDGDICPTGKVASLEMLYTAEDCTATSHSQDPSKVTCSSVAGPLPNTVYIRASDKSSPTDSKAKVWFQGAVTKDNTYVIDASNAGQSQLGTDTYVHIFASQGGALLQTVKFHTSCSQPLRVGDQFGGNFIVAATNTSAGPISIGSPVTFTYLVTNGGSAALSNVVVMDSFGPVPGSPIASIAPGATVKLTRTVLVDADLANTVTASAGNVSCQASDTSNVMVVEPPPVFNGCDSHIKEIKMKWAGAQNIKVVAHYGDTTKAVIATIDNVTPGTVVTVSGYAGSPNDVTWELFLAGTNTKIGESQFHLSCSDSAMNGPEDCNSAQGDGKKNVASLINLWQLVGLTTEKGSTLVCP